MILKQQQIPVHVVNTTVSKTTNKKTLFVAVRNPELIKTYAEQSRGFFTQEHFDELKTNGHLPRTNRHSHSHQQRSQSRSHRYRH